jgi:recombinational DNA repair ATPase RecF
VRIKKIEIQNFRAFYGRFEINLDNAGKNLLLYGENGSGKSSLFYALKFFLESTDAKTDFSNHKNIFVTDETQGFIKLTLDNAVYEWSAPTIFPDDPIILNANKTKGFLDYKNLLETHFLHRQQDSVNLFHLLVENLLANYIEPSSGRAIGHIWQSIQEKSAAKKSTNAYKKELPLESKLMNDVLTKALSDLESKTNELLVLFNYQIILNFRFSLGLQRISLDIKFFNQSIANHHNFLNEARLSAIALSIYFVSIIQQPKSELPILALDDVLIGLDMSNRLPVIDILEHYFSEYQIFFITHDKLWFEMMKMRTEEKKWKYAEFYCNPNNGIELPIYTDNKKYLERAKEHLQANDYRAAAVYTRTAFEVMLKKFCESKNLKVKYRENIKALESNDFWTEIKLLCKENNTLFLCVKLVDKIELYRSVVLNPLSHSQIISLTKDEVNKAVEAVEKLELALTT